MYAQGLAGTVSREEAVSWLQQSSQQGHPRAAALLERVLADAGSTSSSAGG